ncbi:hypothetical protein AAE478_001860 [Parahypoxylon ruwenzoriense]
MSAVTTSTNSSQIVPSSSQVAPSSSQVVPNSSLIVPHSNPSAVNSSQTATNSSQSQGAIIQNQTIEDDSDSEHPAAAGLPDSFEFLRRFGVLPDESESSYAARVEAELRALTQKVPGAEGIRIGGLRKKRAKETLSSAGWDSAINSWIELTRDSARISLLLALNPSQLDLVINYALKGKDWPDEVIAYAFFTARKRLKSNFATWKHRSLEHLEAYIRNLEQADDRFRAEKDQRRTQEYLEDKFNLDDFLNIFDFVKPILDVRRSSEKLQQWCLLIFCELGAYTKLHVNYTRMKNPPLKHAFNRENLLNRFDVCSDLPQWQGLRPARHDVKTLRKTPTGANKKRKRKDGITDHMNDPCAFIPKKLRTIQQDQADLDDLDEED